MILSTCLPAAYNGSYQVQTNDKCSPDQYFIQEDSGEVKLSVCLTLPSFSSTSLSHPLPFFLYLRACLTLPLPVCLQVRNNPKRSCQFNRTMLEECSGILDRFYGYSRGQPCILIKLNRVGHYLTLYLAAMIGNILLTCPSLQVIGMLPGKDGQSPYVTCGAKV